MALGGSRCGSPRASTLDLTRGLELVADVAVKRVAISNPQTAPYGVAAMQALEASKLTHAATPKLVRGQSAAQTAQFAASGNADLALIPRALAVQLGDEGRWVLVESSLYSPVTHAAAVLKPSVVATAFLDFLLSDTGRVAFEVL